MPRLTTGENLFPRFSSALRSAFTSAAGAVAGGNKTSSQLLGGQQYTPWPSLPIQTVTARCVRTLNILVAVTRFAVRAFGLYPPAGCRRSRTRPSHSLCGSGFWIVSAS